MLNRGFRWKSWNKTFSSTFLSTALSALTNFVKENEDHLNVEAIQLDCNAGEGYDVTIYFTDNDEPV